MSDFSQSLTFYTFLERFQFMSLFWNNFKWYLVISNEFNWFWLKSFGSTYVIVFHCACILQPRIFNSKDVCLLDFTNLHTLFNLRCFMYQKSFQGYKSNDFYFILLECCYRIQLSQKESWSSDRKMVGSFFLEIFFPMVVRL